MNNLILLRGLVREKRHWGNFPEKLEESLNGGKAVPLDLPGVGEKHNSPAPFMISDYVKELRSELESLKKKFNGPWSILGISMGGMIALEWLSLYPEDFKTGIIVNSSSSEQVSIFKRMSLETIQMIAKLFIKNDLRERERAILTMTTNMTEINDQLLDRWAGFAKDAPIKRETFIRQIFAASRFKSPPSIIKPVLFLATKNDRLAAFINSEMLSRKYNSPFVLHQNAGHDLSLDDGPWLIEQTIEWLKKNEAQ